MSAVEAVASPGLVELKDDQPSTADLVEEANFVTSKFSRALLAALYGDRCYIADILRQRLSDRDLRDLMRATGVLQQQAAAELRWRLRKRRPRSTTSGAARRRTQRERTRVAAVTVAATDEEAR